VGTGAEPEANVNRIRALWRRAVLRAGYHAAVVDQLNVTFVTTSV